EDGDAQEARMSGPRQATVAQATRPRLIEPGLLRREPGMERYRVRGGGATVLTLAAGDQITLTDLEGRQRCELAVFSLEGTPVLPPLALRGSEAPGLGDSTVGQAASRSAHHRAPEPRSLGAPERRRSRLTLFCGDSRPGERESFTAERDVICVVTAPG